MKKNSSFAILSFLAITLLFVGLASAQTLISGKIYNADYTQTISGASVNVDCNGHATLVVSLADGSYAAEYAEEECANGDSVSVNAQKGDLQGYASGTVGASTQPGWDLAIVRVALVPEFGAIAGLVTIFGAIGIFFYVRRD